MEAYMRFTRTVCFSVVTLAMALGASPALASPPELVRDPTVVGSLDPQGPVRNWPGCPRGTNSVFVDRPAKPAKLYFDERTGEFTFYEGQEAFVGWECQPI
jgi:hypothetical protein